MLISVFKTLHIISMVVWMGVLLYMPRLFIYQTEANSKTEPDRSVLISQYKLMAKRLWVRVGWPSMALTIVFGLLIIQGYYLTIWFWVKMVLVAGLIGYHHIIHFANKKLQKDQYKRTINQLASLNQGGIIFLASIVALAVFKDSINYVLMVGGILILAVLVFIGGRAIFKKSSSK